MWHWISFENGGVPKDFLVHGCKPEEAAKSSWFGNGTHLGSFPDYETGEKIFVAQAKDGDAGRYHLPGLHVTATPSQLIHSDILDRYDKLLSYRTHFAVQDSDGTSFSHLRWMLGEIRKMTDAGKAHRWLGYVQGVMICNHLTTVHAEREFTRPYFKGEQNVG